MDSYLAFLPWYVTAIIFVSIINVIIYFGFIWIRRNIPSETIRANHDVASYTLNIIGLMYAVLIGFTIVDVQGRFDGVDRNVQTEANILLNLFRDASIFPDENREQIRKEIRTYVDSVIYREWFSMENHDQFQLHTPSHLHSLWSAYYKFDPQTEKEKIWYRVSIDKLNDLNNARLDRLYSSGQSLGPMMWTLLLVGAICVVVLMFFFHSPSLKTQLFMVGVVAGNIAFMIYFIYSLDTVFTGSIRVDPKAFEMVKNSFDMWEKVQ